VSTASAMLRNMVTPKPLPVPVKIVLVCTKCGAEDGNIVDDYETETRTPEKKCIQCGCRKIAEKEVEMPVKPGRKACKNHPDKYAIKEELCYKCLHERDGIAPYHDKKSLSNRKMCVDCSVKQAKTDDDRCYGCYTKEHGHPFISTKKKQKCDAETMAAPAGNVVKAVAKGPIEKGQLVSSEDLLESRVMRGESPILSWLRAFNTDQLNIVQVNFNGYEDLLDQLNNAAKLNFRTPEQQILYLISLQTGKPAAEASI
jgi:hypothetical protein